MRLLFLQPISVLTGTDLQSIWAPGMFMWAACGRFELPVLKQVTPQTPGEDRCSPHPVDDALSTWSRDGLGTEREATLGTWGQWPDVEQLCKDWPETPSNMDIIRRRVAEQSKDRFWWEVWMPCLWGWEPWRVGGTEWQGKQRPGNKITGYTAHLLSLLYPEQCFADEMLKKFPSHWFSLPCASWDGPLSQALTWTHLWAQKPGRGSGTLLSCDSLSPPYSNLMCIFQTTMARSHSLFKWGAAFWAPRPETSLDRWGNGSLERKSLGREHRVSGHHSVGEGACSLLHTAL